jgi:hypothetical protein
MRSSACSKPAIVLDVEYQLEQMGAKLERSRRLSRT